MEQRGLAGAGQRGVAREGSGGMHSTGLCRTAPPTAKCETALHAVHNWGEQWGQGGRVDDANTRTLYLQTGDGDLINAQQLETHFTHRALSPWPSDFTPLTLTYLNGDLINA